MPGWPERVKTMQANWIGKSRRRALRVPARHPGRRAASWSATAGMYVFTTRADTIMGVTFCAVAPEHPLAAHAAAQTNPKLAAFVDECKRGSVIEADMATMEKKGMPTGLFVTPSAHRRAGRGLGRQLRADELRRRRGDGRAGARRARLRVREEVRPADQAGDRRRRRGRSPTDAWQPWYADKERGRCVNSGKYDGLDVRGRRSTPSPRDLAAKGLGEKQTTYRLRDWGISRQRYWGTPIPIIHCDALRRRAGAREGPAGGAARGLRARRQRQSARASAPTSSTCACPKCGKPAQRETDTMDTFVDSSWYYMRYTCARCARRMVDARNDYWMPMDQYIGGIEHAILHLLYARFWTKVMRDMGLVKFDEPFTRLLTQGMVLNHIYFRRNAQGRHRLLHARGRRVARRRGRITGAVLKADGTAGRVRRRRHDVEVEAQRRRSAGR